MALSEWSKRFGGNVIPDEPGTRLIDVDDMKQNVIARMAMASVVAERLGGQGVYDGGAYTMSDFGGTTSTVVGPSTPTITALNTASNFNTTNKIESIVAADGKIFVAHENDVYRWTTGTTWLSVGPNVFSERIGTLGNYGEVLYAGEDKTTGTVGINSYNGISAWQSSTTITTTSSTKKTFSIVDHLGTMYVAVGNVVWAYKKGPGWISSGTFALSLVKKLVSYRGNLYAAVLSDDGINNKAKVYRWSSGTNWVEIGAWENTAFPGITPNNGMDILDLKASDQDLYVSLLFYDGSGNADTIRTGVYKNLGNHTWTMIGTSIKAECIEYYNNTVHAFGNNKHMKYAISTRTWTTIATYSSTTFPASSVFNNKLYFAKYDSANKNIVEEYAERITVYSGGNQYPPVTLIIYDDGGKAWFFMTEEDILIDFWDTDTSNAQIWAKIRVIGDTTAARGGVADVDIIVKDANNKKPVHHGLLLGTGKVKQSGLVNFYPIAGSFIDSGGSSSLNFSISGDKNESQIIIWNNQTVDIHGGLGVKSKSTDKTLSASASVALDIDLADYPGLEVISGELRLKLSSSLKINNNNQLVLTDDSALSSFTVEDDDSNICTLNLGNLLNVNGNNGISTETQDINQLLLKLDENINSNHIWTGEQFFVEDVVFNRALRLRDLTTQYLANLKTDGLTSDVNISFPSLTSLDGTYSGYPMLNMAWGAPVIELKWTTGAQSLTSDDYQWNIVNWDSETNIDDNMIWRNVAGQKHLVTIGENAAGWYLISANIGVESNNNGIREIKFDGYNSFLNNNISQGMDYMSETFLAIDGEVTTITCLAVMYLSPGDNLYVKILQDSGSPLDISTSTEDNSLKMYRIF